MWVEEKLVQVYERIGRPEKITFISALISGLLAHLYAYTNMSPNFDGISRLYDEQQMTIAGRWALHYASRLNVFMEMPMLIGVITLFFLAVSAALITHLFQLKSGLLAGIWGILFLVFPAVADTNAYIFTAGAYAFAVFLAVMAVYLTEKRRLGGLAGCILLAVSMGIYQTYVTISISLFVLLIFRAIFRQKMKFSQLFFRGGRYIVILAMGTVLYYTVLRLFLWHKKLNLWTYLGMSDVAAGYPIDRIGGILLTTYRQVAEFFFASGRQKVFTGGIPNWSNAFLILSALCLLISYWIRKRNLWKMAAAFSMTALLPIAVNFVQVISPFSAPRLLMQFSYVFVYFYVILVIDVICGEVPSVGNSRVLSTSMVVCFLVIVVVSWEYDNVLYTMLSQVHQSTRSFVTNVVGRIEGCEGYRYGMPVVIVGGFPQERYYSDLPGYDWVTGGSALSSSVIPLNKHIYYYMKDWLNVPYEQPSDQVFFNITGTEAFQQMPLYPDEGSVRIIDGCAVVKMKDVYTPKSQYEVEYDNRR